MKMAAQYALFAFMAGAGVAFQFGVNGQLRRVSGQPVWASLASFFIGTLILSVCFLATRRGWPSAARFAHAPWWIWIGGALGAFYVVASVVAGPRLGAAALIACVIAGQLVASVVIDHFGLVGFAVHAANPGRIIGAILLLGGVACVLRY